METQKPQFFNWLTAKLMAVMATLPCKLMSLTKEKLGFMAEFTLEADEALLNPLIEKDARMHTEMIRVGTLLKQLARDANPMYSSSIGYFKAVLSALLDVMESRTDLTLTMRTVSSVTIQDGLVVGFIKEVEVKNSTLDKLLESLSSFFNAFASEADDGDVTYIEFRVHEGHEVKHKLHFMMTCDTENDLEFHSKTAEIDEITADEIEGVSVFKMRGWSGPSSTAGDELFALIEAEDRNPRNHDFSLN